MKNKIIDIDKEFEGVVFDESAIQGRTKRIQSWNDHPTRRRDHTARVKSQNREKYGKHVYTLRSPGNDLLEFYDKQNESLGAENRAYSIIPPSVVFDIRFRKQWPEKLWVKELAEYCKDYKITSDPTYWRQVRHTRHDWLVDEPHESWQFMHKVDLEKFLQDKFNQKSFHLDIAVVEETNKLVNHCDTKMYWRGLLKGWSIIANEK